MRPSIAIFALSAGIAGCFGTTNKFQGDTGDVGSDDPGTEEADVPPECPTGTYETSFERTVLPAVDVLVVVDNSMTMAEEQARLATSFPSLLQSLLDPALDPDTGLPVHAHVSDLHVGVVSTDMGTGGYTLETCPDPVDGDNGELLHTPDPTATGCEGTYPTFLTYECDECPDADGIGWMATAFGCIGTLGTAGCGFEQQLEAARTALVDNADGTNAGFLRPDSILVVIFISDENDCSVAAGSEGIFDPLRTDLGGLNLRCYAHGEMLEPLGTYVEAFRSLRPDPGHLVLGFIVGVPLSPMCEGAGDVIPDCLTHPDMIEQIDPLNPYRLAPSCSSSASEAFPAVRFVEVAQEIGTSAVVSSICRADYSSTLDSIASRVEALFEVSPYHVDPVPPASDPGNPCRCLAPCTAVEMLPDLRSCESEGKECYRPEGPWSDCAPPETGTDGLEHTLCEIPQAGTQMQPCSAPSMPSCSDPGVVHAIDGPGWTFMARGWIDTAGHDYSTQEIRFSTGMEPEQGSTVTLSCCY